MSSIFRDGSGRLCASIHGFPLILADFLETDIGENPEWCDELLTGVEQARDGHPYQAFGNIYELNAGTEWAEIRNAYDHTVKPLRLSLDELEVALAAWRLAMDTPGPDPDPGLI
jgi:hypothetical protein